MNDSIASPQPVRRAMHGGTIWPLLALLALLLLAFTLRLNRLPAQSLWYDEGVSWYLTRMSLPALTVWTANDIQPPLYYYLLWLWVRLAGTSEYALRFPSVFFGVLTFPLLWITARRLLGKRPARLAALLLALSPLHVYYAQEARMYTMLTFLGLLSSYLLLRLINIQSTNLSWPTPHLWAYVLTAVAALYTHYFAFFLLAAHVLFIIYRWWQARHTPHALKPSVPISIAISIFILYLPWLPFLLTRYGLDTSYWPGTLELGEVARKLFIAFSLGETVTEAVGMQLAIGYGIILLIALVALIINQDRVVSNKGRGMSNESGDHSQPITRYSLHITPYAMLSNLVFLLLYLLVPIALVLLSIYRTPKFNPRYALLASPAFTLLIAGGLSSLISHHAPRFTFHVSRFTLSSKGTYGHVSRFIFTVALIYILATSAYSLRNWFAPYAVNQFNKPDFRITAQLVRERVGPDETVLLSSGHMFPAWAYYYGWEGWHRLPDIEILDVNAILDLSVGDELDHVLRGKRGAWLVRWQNEATDPFDVLPLYLGTMGTQDDYGQFWHMELFHYRLPPDARLDMGNFITYRADADFGDQVRLLGMRQISGPELVLIWQATAEIETNYTIFVHMLDADGEMLVNADHLPTRPTREWQSGQVLPDRVRLGVPSKLPAGDYRIEVGLYDASDPALPRLSLGDGSGDRVTLSVHLEADDLE